MIQGGYMYLMQYSLVRIIAAAIVVFSLTWSRLLMQRFKQAYGNYMSTDLIAIVWWIVFALTIGNVFL